jgi:hypothetical protein
MKRLDDGMGSYNSIFFLCVWCVVQKNESFGGLFQELSATRRQLRLIFVSTVSVFFVFLLDDEREIER